jgi:hypothetical protein
MRSNAVRKNWGCESLTLTPMGRTEAGWWGVIRRWAPEMTFWRVCACSGHLGIVPGVAVVSLS